MTDHPTITPPLELVQEWYQEASLSGAPYEYEQQIAARAAQWGYDQRGEVNEAKLQKARDQELEACVAWLDGFDDEGWAAEQLRADRRPKPQTLSSIALQTLDTIERDAHYLPEITDTIRRAILRLKQLEDSNG